MDPKYGEISRAMRNRGVEIYILGEVMHHFSVYFYFNQYGNGSKNGKALKAGLDNIGVSSVPLCSQRMSSNAEIYTVEPKRISVCKFISHALM